MALFKETEIFVIKNPIVSPSCQIPNNITILHEGRGLRRILAGVNPYEDMKSLQPYLKRINFLGFDTRL
jgi:hypothetical protein